MRLFLKSTLFFIAAVFVLSANANAEENAVKSPEELWFTIKSAYMKIYCENTVDLKTIGYKISNRGLFVNRVYDPNPVGAPAEKIAYMLDRLLKRTKDILGMWPENFNLEIKIFKDRDQLNGEYSRIFGTKPDYKAFYIYKYNTIYTSEEDISGSIVAHEMGHAVVDHYFSAIPPAQVREVLAQYVDLHLEGE
ncbi:MAG: hypothetical protein WC738_02590 [Candidatus Omnitrophota bacterium]|jgi:hypothetical protein